MDNLLRDYAASRDPQLREALVIRHLPLVKFVARKMSANLPSQVEIDDLVSWGSLGLLDALEKFDVTREVQFSTYAVTRIRGSILDGLQKMDWAPKQVTSKVRAVRRLRDVLTNELGYEPSVEQLAYRMDATPAEVRGWLVDDKASQMKSLTPGNSDDDQDFGGHLAQVEADQTIAAEVTEIRNRVHAAIAALPTPDQEILLLYYDQGLTCRQIAAQLGVSVSAATQAHTRLVGRVREHLSSFGGAA